MTTRRGSPAAWRRTTPGLARERLPLLFVGLLCLVAGLWGGLVLLGLPVPTLRRAGYALDHGLMMALGFLGTVISLERAVALGKPWAFTAPAAAGTGGLALLLGFPAAGQLLLLVASGVLLVVYVVVYRIQPALHLKVQAGGAACWSVAMFVWLAGGQVVGLVPWLVGFLVLTILGERLELARIAMLTPTSVRRFLAAAGLLVAGSALTLAAGEIAVIGARIAGLGLAALAVWGMRYDPARRTIKVPGVTRFMAVCLLGGYVWLFAGGVVWVVVGELDRASTVYDAALHAVFLGFVMSMIFGHAPVIVPAVLRIRMPFHRWLYIHVALLHASLAVRLVGGDWRASDLALRVGGVGNELAVLLFIIASALAVLRARKAPVGRSRPIAPRDRDHQHPAEALRRRGRRPPE